MSSATATETQIDIQVVYNGQPKDFKANVHQPLRPIFQRSLAEFGVQAAQPDEYGLFLPGQNNPLALDSKIADLGLSSGTVLHLQRRVPPSGGC